MLIDLFSSWVIAKNAYPDLKPAVQIFCPSCGNIFSGTKDKKRVICNSCNLQFSPDEGNTKHSKVECFGCHHTFPIISAFREEVQDYDSTNFTKKLQGVFQECHRVLKDNGMLVFTYHHSRSEGWQSVIKAILESGFLVINSHPVKSEMSVATPKSQTKNSIQLDIIIVCRKNKEKHQSVETAFKIAEEKINRLHLSGLFLSENDKRIIQYGQLLTVLSSNKELIYFSTLLEQDKRINETPSMPLEL